MLLDLEAVWCHWCHVMDGITYLHPVVLRLLNQHYILVKVDQDSRPEAQCSQDAGDLVNLIFNSMDDFSKEHLTDDATLAVVRVI